MTPKSIFVVAMSCYILLTSASPSQRERLRISTVEGEGPISSHGLQCVTKTRWKQFPQIIALFQSLIIFYKYILVPGINLSNSVIHRNRHHVSSSITVLLCLLFLAATFTFHEVEKEKCKHTSQRNNVGCYACVEICALPSQKDYTSRT